MPKSPQPINILFLDGDCVFCQRSASLLHWADMKNKIFFAPLQGETAQMLPQDWRDPGAQDSAAVLIENVGGDDEIRWRGCDAILRSLWLAGFPYRLLWIGHWLPSWLKNLIYGRLAAVRYRLSKHVTCPIPSEDFLQQTLP